MDASCRLWDILTRRLKIKTRNVVLSCSHRLYVRSNHRAHVRLVKINCMPLHTLHVRTNISKLVQLVQYRVEAIAYSIT